MALFISSKSVGKRHAVYAIESTPPATVRATGTAQCAIIAQFPWGPDQSATTPTDMKNLITMIAPAGMSRTGSGYLSVIRKGWPTPLKFVRVTHSDAAKAHAHMPNAVPTDIIDVVAKYVGAAGNAITATVSNASDGNAQHFNLTVSVTSTTGTTTDLFQNLDFTGTQPVIDFTKTLLTGAITLLAAGRPVNGTVTLATGSDGTLVSSDYVGTQGTADKGVALLERDLTIDHLFADDPGNSFRSAVNAGLQAHADYMTDRIAYINGPSGQSSITTVTTDVANYRSLRVCYVDSWAYILDDVDGTKRLVPSASFAASVAAQLSPSTSIAWKGVPVGTMLEGMVGLEYDRGEAVATLTDAGVTTLINEPTGGFRFEAAVNTNNPVDPARGTLNRTRMGHYIARSVVQSLRPFVDAPNVPQIQNDEIAAVDIFLSKLKRAAKVDPINNPHILDYAIHSVSDANSTADLQAGEFNLNADVTISAAQSKIYFNMKFGETVSVATQL